jgi:thioredoxin-related protein
MFDKKWNKIFQLPGYADPSQMITFMKFVKGLDEGKYTTKEWRKFLKDNGVS